MTQKYFDEAALTWDEKPGRVKTAMEMAASIRNKLRLNESTHLLDYGCGTGLVSLSLIPDVGRITGADTSSGMLEIFQKKIERNGIHNCNTVHINETDVPFPENHFDAIISVMTFHHIPDTTNMIQRLASHLKPGGSIAIVDLDSEDGTFHLHGNDGIAHLGFDRNHIGDLLSQNGFTNVDLDTAYTVRRDEGKEYPIFIATAQKS